MKTKDIQAEVSREKILVTVYMQRHIDELFRVGKGNTARNYQSAQHSFNRFLNGKVLYVDEINTFLIKEYEAWMTGKRLSQNSSSCYLRQLRAIWHKATAEGLSGKNFGNPFKEVFTGTRQTLKRGLVESEGTEKVPFLAMSV